MKWPWVSRERFDNEREARRVQMIELRRAEALLAGQSASLERQHEWMRESSARFDALLEKYHALRIEGSVMHPSVPAGVPSDAVERAASAIVRMAAEPDELKSLIHDLCGTDYRKRAMMLRQLASDRANKVPETNLRALIINGIQGDGVPS